jgi:broad specificity phosphatase PhoE
MGPDPERCLKLMRQRLRNRLVARCSVLGVLLLGLLPVVSADPRPDDDLLDRLRGSGQVLLLRHAEAPGIGDPDDFRLDDCSTQRNLSPAGREQAATIGRRLREPGVGARVYSSQWCRCLETARLLGLGPVTPLPALNSFFGRPAEREPRLAALRAFLAQAPRDRLLVLVTHQVTVTALTGVYPGSGEAVLAALNRDGSLRSLVRMRLGD